MPDSILPSQKVNLRNLYGKSGLRGEAVRDARLVDMQLAALEKAGAVPAPSEGERQGRCFFMPNTPILGHSTGFSWQPTCPQGYLMFYCSPSKNGQRAIYMCDDPVHDYRLSYPAPTSQGEAKAAAAHDRRQRVRRYQREYMRRRRAAANGPGG